MVLAESNDKTPFLGRFLQGKNDAQLFVPRCNHIQLEQ